MDGHNIDYLEVQGYKNYESLIVYSTDSLKVGFEKITCTRHTFKTAWDKGNIGCYPFVFFYIVSAVSDSWYAPIVIR